MSQPAAKTRRRPPSPDRKPAAPPTRAPADESLVLEALRAANSQWWELGPAGLEQVRRLAAEKMAFPLIQSPQRGLVPGGSVETADQQRVLAFLSALPEARLPCAIDCRLAGPDTPRWVRLTVLRRAGPARNRHFAGIITDISPLKKLESQILQISEHEKNRIGQDLHDDLCQVLAGLACLTHVMENRLAPALPQETEGLREINRQLVDAMERTRALTHGLYPARMRSGDIRAALLELAQQVGVRFGVKVRTGFRGRFPAHTAQEILNVYRIAQEAISNAIRHGHATNIDLELERHNSSMRLSVHDDGTGFPAAANPPDGIGLQIMQHRAAQIGAEIQIGNTQVGGAHIALTYQPVALL